MNPDERLTMTLSLERRVGPPPWNYPDSVILMAKRVQTRKRGEAALKVAMLAKVDPAVKAKVEKVAQALGVSQAAAVEAMLMHAHVDAHGRPDWFDGPLATDAHEELPLASTA